MLIGVLEILNDLLEYCNDCESKSFRIIFAIFFVKFKYFFARGFACFDFGFLQIGRKFGNSLRCNNIGDEVVNSVPNSRIVLLLRRRRILYFVLLTVRNTYFGGCERQHCGRIYDRKTTFYLIK